MQIRNLLPYKLQFFAADAESVETPEVAEPAGTEVENEPADNADSEEGQQVEVEQPQFDANAIAAAARRQAENDARIRQQKIDEEYQRRFGHLNNPITGKSIRTQQDYLEALDAQQQIQAEAQLRENGVDPSILNQLIAANPSVRRAEEVIAQAERMEVERQIMADIASLSEIDDSIHRLEDVPYEVVQKSMQTGMSLVDAYKIVNYGKVSTAKREAIQQAAINAAKGKQHMAPVDGVSTNDGLKEIPENEIAKWKAFFPEASNEELRKKYNRVKGLR